MALLTPEERNFFRDEYTRLKGARSELSKDSKYSQGFTRVLKECDALKESIASTCGQRLDDIVMKDVQVSPATLSTTEAREPSIASVESSPHTAPSSDGSISDQSNSATTNSNSRRPPSMDTVASNTAETRQITLRTSTGAFSVTSDTPVTRQSTSRTSVGLSMVGNPFAQRVREIECMSFGPNSNAGSPTYNIYSDGSTGATHTFQGNGQSRILPRTQQRPTNSAYQQRDTDAPDPEPPLSELYWCYGNRFLVSGT
ncbi:hypothetical protein AZE42_09650 [Rhizopogon vesiculosus]|uniref:Uncharacterized protein n=1 Tax=Rhizopogon vesiculosus TaxID=180088 RepID=A0A1J8QQ70_9AGAM|nr:hypothetical protein AZE42_09650 [Rhizopogon vesiculosus]